MHFRSFSELPEKRLFFRDEGYGEMVYKEYYCAICQNILKE